MEFAISILLLLLIVVGFLYVVEVTYRKRIQEKMLTAVKDALVIHQKKNVSRIEELEAELVCANNEIKMLEAKIAVYQTRSVDMVSRTVYNMALGQVKSLTEERNKLLVEIQQMRMNSYNSRSHWRDTRNYYDRRPNTPPQQKTEKKRTLYQVLHLQPDCTQQKVKQNYKHMSMMCHPDHGGTTKAMQQVNRAYEILSDPEKRKKYDAQLRNMK